MRRRMHECGLGDNYRVMFATILPSHMSGESRLSISSSLELAGSSDFNFFNSEEILFSPQCDLAVLRWKYIAMASHLNFHSLQPHRAQRPPVTNPGLSL